jgi:aconitase A
MFSSSSRRYQAKVHAADEVVDADFDPRHDPATTSDGRTFKLAPPVVAPEVPQDRLAASGGFHPPTLDGAQTDVAIEPDSRRMQRLAPWPRWDGRDFVEIPVLVKVKGKTTTDQISSAGRWLELRHSYSEERLGWFRSGSVLNFLRESTQA